MQDTPSYVMALCNNDKKYIHKYVDIQGNLCARVQSQNISTALNGPYAHINHGWLTWFVVRVVHQLVKRTHLPISMMMFTFEKSLYIAKPLDAISNIPKTENRKCTPDLISNENIYGKMYRLESHCTRTGCPIFISYGTNDDDNDDIEMPKTQPHLQTNIDVSAGDMHMNESRWWSTIIFVKYALCVVAIIVFVLKRKHLRKQFVFMCKWNNYLPDQ